MLNIEPKTLNLKLPVTDSPFPPCHLVTLPFSVFRFPFFLMFLNCHTYHSLRYGVLSPQELVQRAVAAGAEVLVLTDINSTSGVFDFVAACRAAGITPLVGLEFHKNGRLLYTGIARNFTGFGELNRFLTSHRLSQQPLPDVAPAFQNAFVVYPFHGFVPVVLRENEFVGIRHFQLNRLLTSPLSRQMHKLLVWQPVVFASCTGFEVHRHLRAVDGNRLLSRITEEDMASRYDWPVSAERLKAAFNHYPVIWKNTCDFLKRCSFDFDFKTVKNKQSYTGSRSDDEKLLEQLALDGMEFRYGPNHSEARERIRKELDIISKLGFAAYFLITWDIIRYSMSRGFYHVGRGSGANSVVAYCLKITDVDPIELNLYFERFLNPKRSSPPDFDIDYSWRERDDVQQYIFKRYGREHVALLGAISTFQERSVIRELGKIYGLPSEELERMTSAGFNPAGEELPEKIFSIAAHLKDFPNLRTIHAGGILISDAPITAYTALDLPPKGLPTTQFDMYVAEDIGFEKLDILSQRGIGHIKDCASIVLQNRGEKVDVHQVERFKHDERVKELLRKGETNGCFYIESPATRGLLIKLRCDNYLTLVAASSIIRPGVSRSGMMREYIERFHNPNGFNYLHPVMEEQLKETFGVMVYQEDVIKVCHHFAGLDLADSDVLRRAMSGKYRSRAAFQRIVDKFFSNCKERGYHDALTGEVWRQIESFAGYSFSKAHSASYAVESFQSLYLKAYYPLEFMVAVINNFGGFYATWVYVHEAARWGGKVHVSCVNRSSYLTSIDGKDIFLGFVHIRDLEQVLAHRIVDERKRGGEYVSLPDFIERTAAGREQIVLLIRLGALRFTGKNKPQLLWEAHLYLTREKIKEPIPRLFPAKEAQYSLPRLIQQPLEDAYDEIELLGFPVTMNYFDLLQTRFRGEVKARHLSSLVGTTVKMTGRLVTIKYVRTVSRKLMHFAAFLDDDGQFFDTTHFPPVLKKYPFQGNGIYLIQGKVVSEFGFPSIEVEKMAILPLNPDPRSS
ncbi:DNA polymerase III subunit alpha [Alkalitalea saponilacus]|uniref:DNA polymerase III subunit alpha n=1 Tax=Alkalitalea saponilacus TaxID=889453 RepID=A0A1T5HSS0_9BACT|nr:DNA polymerase III subunit alpha [Alkalitalea saponilacus]SKC23687.1 DNA polymerase-3 subunit alpha [Alkalitalea saponilacus]